MKRLFIGCRVRIVENAPIDRHAKIAINREGIITGRCDHAGKPHFTSGVGHKDLEWHVDVEGTGSWCATSAVLEPIIPEGNKVISWEECLWTPHHNKV